MSRPPALRLTALVLAGVIGAVGVGLGASVSGRQDLNLETFDAAWTIIYETHWDPQFNGVDWLALREELRPLAEQAESPAELRAVIIEMLSRLGQSHFGLWPRGTLDAVRPDDAGGPGDPGFETTLIDAPSATAKLQLVTVSEFVDRSIRTLKKDSLCRLIPASCAPRPD